MSLPPPTYTTAQDPFWFEQLTRSYSPSPPPPPLLPLLILVSLFLFLHHFSDSIIVGNICNAKSCRTSRTASIVHDVAIKCKFRYDNVKVSYEEQLNDSINLIVCVCVFIFCS